MSGWETWAADGAAVAGLLIMTLAVAGAAVMPDVYLKVHAAAKALVMGIVPLLLATLAGSDAATAERVLLIVVLLLVTTPVGAHAISLGAYRSGEPLRAPDTVNEMGGLPEAEEADAAEGRLT